MSPEVIESEMLDHAPAFVDIESLERLPRSSSEEPWNRPRTVVLLTDHESVSVVESALEHLADVTTHDVELLGNQHLFPLLALLPCTGINLLCDAGAAVLAEAAKQVRRSIPMVIVIAVLAECGREDLRRLLRTGINGCLLASQVVRDGLTEALIACSISSSVVLSHHLCWLLAAVTIQEPSTELEGVPPALTPRQMEVLRRLADGLTGTQIAQDLGISEKTVQAHLGRARVAFGCNTTYQLCALWGREMTSTVDGKGANPGGPERERCG